MKVAILCGGRGTRLREETEVRPKPLVTIGGRPILWHIMRHYAHHGFKDFVLCLGYKGEMIKEYFLNYQCLARDFTLELGSGRREFHGPDEGTSGWRVTFAETGPDTPTGGRVWRAARYLDGERFLLTYGDGLSNVDLGRLLAFHQARSRVGTLTAVHPMSPFGVIEVEQGAARSFKEKPRLQGLINGGFFVFERRFLDYLREDSVLEEEPLRRLSAEGQLAAYEHDDFWACMDTYKDVERLHRLWDSGDRPWKVWGEGPTP
ncbi:MAG: glucose-1-phosphate cytidylyltransferase [Planctomycetes bacterium]|nr:glucose-1-phosphate cytidylyltransferase [Planctomycetota bacterium]